MFFLALLCLQTIGCCIWQKFRLTDKTYKNDSPCTSGVNQVQNVIYRALMSNIENNSEELLTHSGKINWKGGYTYTQRKQYHNIFSNSSPRLSRVSQNLINLMSVVYVQ